MDQGLAPSNGSIRLLPLVAHFADEETELERLNFYEVPTASMWQSLGLNPGNLGSKLRLFLWSEQWSPARLPDLDSEMLEQHRITLPFTVALPRAMYWDLVLQKPKMSFPKTVFNLDVPQDTLT